MGLLQNSNAIPTAAAAADFYDYQIPYSCRFDKASTSYLTTANLSGVTTNSQFTASFWVKRSSLDTSGQQPVIGNSDGAGQLEFRTDYTFKWASYGTLVNASRVFRDTSAWAHFYIYRSTSDGAGTIYINGVQETLTSNTAGSSGIFRDGKKIQVGGSNDGGALFGGYIAEVHVFYDQNIALSNFGEFKNGVWIPKEYTGSYGSAYDFYLKFEDASNLGNDSSGNDNDFTINNLAASDQMLDSPTFGDEGSSNFPTWNALDYTGFNNQILAEGNLELTLASSSYAKSITTMGAKTGKYYWETSIETQASGAYDFVFIGVSDKPAESANEFLGKSAGSAGWEINTSGSPSSFVVSGNANIGTVGDATDYYSQGDIIACALDLDASTKTIAFYKNGTAIGSAVNLPAAMQDIYLLPASSDYQAGGGISVIHLNCGQDSSFSGTDTGTAGPYADGSGFGSFYYQPPSGFLALCAGNLPTPAADPASETDAGDGGGGPQNYFKTLTYAGGTTGHVTGFQPDLVWVKRYTAGQSNGVWDSTRGATKILITNANSAEGTSSGLTVFNSDGYDMGTYYNQAGNSYVSWSWKANGGTTSSNTEGSITSTVQVDDDRGFSIVTYTGESASRTVGHGLSIAPDCLLIKSIGGTRNWVMYNRTIGPAVFPYLNTTGAADTGTVTFNDTDPTDAVFSIGDGSETGKSEEYVAYCFVNKEGYSRFGRYEGNGNADGTFVYCGFRPAWIITKSIDSTSDWLIWDNKRLGYNVDNNELEANTADAQGTTDMIDILSNGFKFRIATDPNVAETYIYMAFAHNPFKYATAR